MGLVDSLNDAFNKGVSGTERLLEVGKLKNRISILGKSRIELLAQLGAVAYEQFRAGTGSIEAFTALGERIRAVEIDIAQAQGRLDSLEAAEDAATVRCVECGNMNALAARFCVKCGSELHAAPPTPFCPSCGGGIPEGGKFCVRCGSPVDAVDASAAHLEVEEQS